MLNESFICQRHQQLEYRRLTRTLDVEVPMTKPTLAVLDLGLATALEIGF